MEKVSPIPLSKTFDAYRYSYPRKEWQTRHFLSEGSLSKVSCEHGSASFGIAGADTFSDSFMHWLPQVLGTPAPKTPNDTSPLRTVLRQNAPQAQFMAKPIHAGGNSCNRKVAIHRDRRSLLPLKLQTIHSVNAPQFGKKHVREANISNREAVYRERACEFYIELRSNISTREAVSFP